MGFSPSENDEIFEYISVRLCTLGGMHLDVDGQDTDTLQIGLLLFYGAVFK